MRAATKRQKKKTLPLSGCGEPLVAATVETLKNRIVAGEFADGELPPQGQLCLELGVSRSVVREAMRQLQSQRLIAISQGMPARVLPATAAGLTDSLQLLIQRAATTMADLSEVRLPLEAEIAALAAERIDEEGLLRLHISVRKLREARDVPERIESDLEFHHELAAATGNPIFTFLLDALAEMLRASRSLTIGNVGVGPALAGHVAILTAVQARDAVAARAAMIDHIQAAQRDLKLAEEQQTEGRA